MYILMFDIQVRSFLFTIFIIILKFDDSLTHTQGAIVQMNVSVQSPFFFFSLILSLVSTCLIMTKNCRIILYVSKGRSVVFLLPFPLRCSLLTKITLLKLQSDLLDVFLLPSVEDLLSVSRATYTPECGTVTVHISSVNVIQTISLIQISVNPLLFYLFLQVV